MSRPNPPYTHEFRQRIIDLVHSGRSIRTICEEFKVSQQTILNWVKQSELDVGLKIPRSRGQHDYAATRDVMGWHPR